MNRELEKKLGPVIVRDLFVFDFDTRSDRTFLRPNVNMHVQQLTIK